MQVWSIDNSISMRSFILKNLNHNSRLSKSVKTTLILYMFVLGLTGCVGDDSDNQELVFPPQILFDYPFSGSASIATTATTLDLSGLTLSQAANNQVGNIFARVGSSSTFDANSFTVTDQVGAANLDRTSSPGVVYFKQSLGGLSTGTNFVQLRADYASNQLLSIGSIVRGTGLQYFTAVHDLDGTEYLVLDAARKKLYSYTGNVATEVADLSTALAINPVDMVVDGTTTAYVLDAGETGDDSKIISVTLSNGSAVSSPSLAGLDSPVAIELIGADLYVLDAGTKKIHTLTASPFGVLTDLTVAEAFEQPVDLVSDANTLYISDRRKPLSEGALVDTVLKITDVTAPPIIPIELFSDESSGSIGLIGRLAFKNDTIFLLDLTLNNIKTIDTTVVPATSISTVLLTGIGVVSPSDIYTDASRDRLLVTDNFFGGVLQVDELDSNSSLYLSGPNESSGTKELEATSSSDFNVSEAVLSSNNNFLYSLDQNSNGVIFSNISLDGRGICPQAFDTSDADDDRDFIFNQPKSLVLDTLADGERLLVLNSNGTDYDLLSMGNSCLGDVREEVVLATCGADCDIGDPLSMVLLQQTTSETDSTLVHNSLYVLDSDSDSVGGLVEIDLINNVETLLTITGCSLSNVNKLLVFGSGDADSANNRVLLLEDGDGSSDIYAIDETGTCNAVGFGLIPSDDYFAVLDNRDVESDAELGILIVDAENNDLSRVVIDVGAFTAAGFPSTQSLSEQFISPNAMVFDEIRERLYVLDDLVRSMYSIDVKRRDSSGKSDADSGTVSGQITIISRGASLFE